MYANFLLSHGCSYSQEHILCSLCTLLHNMGVILHVVTLTILLASQFVKVFQSVILIGYVVHPSTLMYMYVIQIWAIFFIMQVSHLHSSSRGTPTIVVNPCFHKRYRSAHFTSSVQLNLFNLIVLLLYAQGHNDINKLT